MSRLFRSTPEPYYATKSADAQELAKEVDNIPVVTANPELAGTEANLTGLQVGNTKYAVPSPGIFLVDISGETTDKTYQEIQDAITAGKVIYGHEDGNTAGIEQYCPFIGLYPVGDTVEDGVLFCYGVINSAEMSTWEVNMNWEFIPCKVEESPEE